jgi:tRNA A-37 threonylcarbamoyl transferase component Bud32
MRKGAEILASDRFGEKVLRLVDGSIIKLFRRKRLISSALIYPYALRFVNNAKILKMMGIRTVTVIDAYKISSIRRTAVHYIHLEGETLRNHIAEYSLNTDSAKKLAAFIGMLHNKGIYFRSIHFGNILISPDGDLGLIDLADMKIRNSSLSTGERSRNFYHLTRYENDINALKPQKEAFIMEYLNTCVLAPEKIKKMEWKINAILSRN